MPPKSQFKIATDVLNRYIKELASYRKEIAQQKTKIAKLEQDPGDDENAEFILRQERQSQAEAEKVIQQDLKPKYLDAIAKLESQLEQVSSGSTDIPSEEVLGAKEVLATAKAETFE